LALPFRTNSKVISSYHAIVRSAYSDGEVNVTVRTRRALRPATE